MSVHPAFDLLRDEAVPEIASTARLYRHKATGAEVLSLANADENKVFGITFKTPPSDSTGIAHILEHSVLCGSRKYPVKKPFVELLKGSLHTFLNAMTFPDKTAYPVASQNLRDFYNLVDVYLDAVFFPNISEDILRQEGWHYELDGKDAPLVYKGVVFNEMKGVFSSPDAVLGDASMRSLFPDTTYGQSSGGDPKVIPDLTYEDFIAFHKRYYHPSNARAFFYGDDDPEQRLAILDEYFSQFDRIAPDAEVKLQPRFNAPRQLSRTYAGSIAEGKRRDGMVTLNWMLDEITDDVESLKFAVLEHALIGTSAAPLRKAITDARLGESFIGNFSDSLRQPTVTLGLKGIDPEDAGRVEALILDTLKSIAEQGIDRGQLESSLNTLEFSLRENNTGSFPRGIALMFRSLRTWLHDGDPLSPLAFEAALHALKTEIATEPHMFEAMIRQMLLENVHRTTVKLAADPEQGEREAEEEREKLSGAAALMDEAQRAEVQDITVKLKALQDSVDAPEDLAKIPGLTLEDLPRVNKTIPTEFDRLAGTETLYHDLPTSGIVYLDLAFGLHALGIDELPYLPIFARALLQTGTSKEDFVALTQRIGRETGGIGAQISISTKVDGESVAAHLILRGKATPDKSSELLFILSDVLTDARLDNRDRIRQMVLETKAGLESRLAPMGNRLVDLRLRSGLNRADWLNEQVGGVSYLFFIRKLAERIESDWPAVQATFEGIRDRLLARAGAIANVTADAPVWEQFRPRLEEFLRDFPEGNAPGGQWSVPATARSEGLVIPAQVNFVGKGANLHALGYPQTGATSVALKHLNTTWLWDKIRVQGGAYGGSSRYDVYSGAFTFLSYRDPNLLKTLDAYDGAASFLSQPLGEQELTRSIIGVIGDVDTYMLPDAKGFTALQRHLVGSTEALRQQRREEILSASQADFVRLGEALAAVAADGHVAVLGSEAAITAANADRGGFLDLVRVA